MRLKIAESIKRVLVVILILVISTIFLGDKLKDLIGAKKFLIIESIIFIAMFLSVAIFLVVNKKGRKIFYESSLNVIIFLSFIGLGGFVFIYFIGDLTVFVNNTYELGVDNWLSYFGAILGAGITVIGAYYVTRLQNFVDNKSKIKANAVLLSNDLKYINSRVDSYIELINDNKNNEHFYRIRYLNISENWRELVSYLFQNGVLENDEVAKLYDFFSDIYYLTDKYNELSQINISELDSESQHKGKFNNKKVEIKRNINDKYIEMTKHKIRVIVEKLDRIALA